MFLTRVTELIKSRGITKNKLLVELGLNTNAFKNWENRNTVPGGDTLSKIADYFHVSTDYLLGRTDDPRPVGEEKEPAAVSEDDPLRSALLDNFDQLNQEGREKLVDLSDDMVATGKYIKSDPAKLGKAKYA